MNSPVSFLTNLRQDRLQRSEMFSWNKIINALKRSRGNINPFTTFKPLGWKCYKTIGSYVSCAFMEIWSTWKVWGALKRLTHLSCSPNFLCALYLDEHTLTYQSIVHFSLSFRFPKGYRELFMMTSSNIYRSELLLLFSIIGCKPIFKLSCY